MGKSKKLKFYLGSILTEINNGRSPYGKVFLKKLFPELSYEKAKSRIYYWVRCFERNGNIEDTGYGTWKVISEEVKKTPKVGIAHHDTKVKKKGTIRGHAFRLKLRISKIKGWGDRQKFLDSKNISYKSVNVGFGSYQQLKVGGWVTWLCSESIIFYAPRNYSVFSDGSDNCLLEFLKDWKLRVKRLEKLLGLGLGGFKINGYYEFRVFGSHYSRVKDILARLHKKSGKGLKCFKSGKGLWLVIDDSFNFEELETVAGNDVSRLDEKKISKFFNDYDDFPLTTKDIFLMFKEQSSFNSNFMIQQEAFAKNIDLHLKTMEEIKLYFERLNRK